MNRTTNAIDAIIVTGPVGAGKSTVAATISEVLEQREIPHAMIDQDYLRWVYPAPPDDRFSARLGLRNLAAVWANIRETGPRCLIVADVVEDRAQSLADYRAALPGTEITVVRLDVPMPVILNRLEGRETPESIAWYRNRAPELQGIMERGSVEDVLIDAGRRNARDIAEEIIERVGVT